ncbi:uncharacterized protein LOC106012364 [Aplysia californica]|uniref:Uncharacterized protein LOC106012364 n=1 Tax=Aplysia californica TaxID=6500 RepID=A0ABM1A4C7_APLCA|nr:uncharacterized protein LOC106012364 [Aplysia californica]XP_012940597.1 uncharacterized protein LOC106012364 [Aplysia californica]XP_012940598.1 uncharacterized protein LOC106012364 [Aplysia californica]
MRCWTAVALLLWTLASVSTAQNRGRNINGRAGRFRSSGGRGGRSSGQPVTQGGNQVYIIREAGRRSRGSRGFRNVPEIVPNAGPAPPEMGRRTTSTDRRAGSRRRESELPVPVSANTANPQQDVHSDSRTRRGRPGDRSGRRRNTRGPLPQVLPPQASSQQDSFQAASPQVNSQEPSEAHSTDTEDVPVPSEAEVGTEAPIVISVPDFPVFSGPRRSRRTSFLPRARSNVDQSDDSSFLVSLPGSETEVAGDANPRGTRRRRGNGPVFVPVTSSTDSDASGTSIGEIEEIETTSQQSLAQCSSLMETSVGGADDTILTLFDNIDNPDVLAPILSEIASNFLASQAIE